MAIYGLVEDLLAVRRPARRAAGLLGFQRRCLLAIQAEYKDTDVAQVPAGDGNAFAIGGETRVGVGALAPGELLCVLAAGVHAPDFHVAATIADKNNGPLETGRVELAGFRRDDECGFLHGWPRFPLPLLRLTV